MLIESVETHAAFGFWALVWVICLILPPGSQAINTAYRLNFVHGVLCTVLAVMALNKMIPENLATTSTLSYFIVDFCNIMLNDFYFKAKSYQKPDARKLEYFHHIMCCTLGLMSEFLHQDYCQLRRPTHPGGFEPGHNPFVELMFAELSTPALMAWRYTKDDPKLKAISSICAATFAVTFFFARIIYHGLFFIPKCASNCHESVAYGFGAMYNLMNLYFMFQIAVLGLKLAGVLPDKEREHKKKQ